MMTDRESSVDERIARRVRALRDEQGLSLDALSAKCGVSRSMLSLVERGESSPTAAVLEKIAAGLDVTLPALFDAADVRSESPEPISRRATQVEWRDPASGYVRRNVSPPGVPQPMQIVEIRFPAGRRVAFETAGRDARVHQQIWVLDGTMDVTIGSERHRLRAGDCLAMQLGPPTMFHNPTRKAARYAVVIATEPRSKR
jgi:transcriptional regulator with XRE-family HTH domain